MNMRIFFYLLLLFHPASGKLLWRLSVSQTITLVTHHRHWLTPVLGPEAALESSELAMVFRKRYRSHSIHWSTQLNLNSPIGYNNSYWSRYSLSNFIAFIPLDLDWLGWLCLPKSISSCLGWCYRLFACQVVCGLYACVRACACVSVTISGRDGGIEWALCVVKQSTRTHTLNWLICIVSADWGRHQMILAIPGLAGHMATSEEY